MTRPEIIRAGMCLDPPPPLLARSWCLFVAGSTPPVTPWFAFILFSQLPGPTPKIYDSLTFWLTFDLSPSYLDTIDLQDREAPSAKDHPRAPIPTSNGSLAPHQAETIREVAAETAEENLRSPGLLRTGGEVEDLHQYADQLVSGVNNSLNGHPGASDARSNIMQAGQPRDALAIAQNGGVSGADVDDGDLSGDGDDSMDDDMMDKISSSPSIEDGGSPSSTEPFWSRRIDSLHPPPFAFPSTSSDSGSSSLYLEHRDPLDMSISPEREGKAFFDSPCRRHHLPAGEYNIQEPPLCDDESKPSTFDTP